MKKADTRMLEDMRVTGPEFARWPTEDLLQVWRDRKPCVVVTSWREVRVLHLNVDMRYAGMIAGLGGDPRQIAIENAAWRALDPEFERRVRRAYKQGEDWLAIVEIIRANQNAKVFIVDFGEKDDTDATAPDSLWQIVRLILSGEKKDVNFISPEINEMREFYPEFEAKNPEKGTSHVRFSVIGRETEGQDSDPVESKTER